MLEFFEDLANVLRDILHIRRQLGRTTTLIYQISHIRVCRSLLYFILKYCDLV